MDADQAVDEARDIDDASREAEAAERVTEVCGVGGEEDTADAQLGRAALVHLVGADVGDGVGVGRGVAGQESSELLGLPGEVFGACQACDVAVGNAPERVAASAFAYACGHEVVLGVDDEVGVVPAELIEVDVCLAEVSPGFGGK